ncbi:putative transcription factor homeobox-WOX family [Dioscorea sansibarensis]
MDHQEEEDTGLVLGLGFGDKKTNLFNKDHCRKDGKRSAGALLSLSLFDEAFPVRVKKEMELGCGGRDQEVFMESVSKASDEDDDGGAKKKLRLTKEQSCLLEDRFKEHSTLNPKQKQALAKQLNLRPRQVEVWFQNRRARTKLKQTEVDCEVLKRCCEALTDENRRLKKELQELKSVNLAVPPLYMQLPAATLTICPSCERLAGANDSPPKGGTGAFVITPKTHFYNPSFSHSAAC